MVDKTMSSQSNIPGGVTESSRSSELLTGPRVKLLLTFSKVKNELSVFNSNIISPPQKCFQ